MRSFFEPVFLQRLEALKDRLLPAIRRLDLTRPYPSGFSITPEVDSHRPYTPGDDTRYIDWNLYARLDRFYLKSMVKEEEGVTDILIDVSESMRIPSEEKLERAIEVAAALTYIMVAAGGKVTHYSWSEGILSYQEHQGLKGQPIILLQALSSAPQGKATDLHKTLRGLFQMSRPSRSRLILISDFIDLTAYNHDLEYLRSSGVKTTAIQILHSRETRLSKKGYLRISDPETGGSLTQLVGYRALKDAQREANRFFQWTADRFRNLGFSFSRHFTEQSFEEIVSEYLLTDGEASRLGSL